ncbi:potassium efflux system KefA [Legionella beliardensis]|uniref:Potassium efflux system KefA n=1 Tax=Legionella beliardensis TaxID=91822 RepID=A0A378I2J4_9GAMM|nr:mechanosensitive ion channel domain-containing protein [Legionella beliardensis]STX28921.1 potassium efflux system KefA [Legionella beliardensis]
MNWEFALHPTYRYLNKRHEVSFGMLRKWLFVIIVLLLCTTMVFARSSTNNSSKLIEYLTQEKTNFTLVSGEAKLFALPTTDEDYLKKVQQNEALIALNKAKIANLESFLITQKKLQADFGLRLKQLQQFQVTDSPQINSQAKIERINSLNEVNKRTIELINENLSLATRYQELLLEQKHKLDLWKSKAQLRQRLGELHAQEDKLNQSLDKLYENSLTLQQKIKAEANSKTVYLLEAKLLLNNQVINLTQHKKAGLNLQRKLIKADYELLRAPDIRTLQMVTEVYKNTISQLSDMEQALKKMVQLLNIEQRHLTEASLKQQFSTLTSIINKRIADITIQEQTLQEDLENHQQELKKQLSVRQSLSEYRIDSWPVIIHELSRMPMQFYSYLKSLALKTRDNYLWQDTVPAIFIWLTLIVTAAIFYFLQHLLKRLTQDKERSRLSGHLYGGLLTLLSRNMPYLAFISTLFLMLYLNKVPFSNYQLLINLILVWLTFRTMLLIARLILLERISDSSGKDVKLYYQVKWLLLAGGWTTALMVFSYQLPLPLILQDIFNRLFMLFLVAVSILVLKSKDVITHLLYPVLKNKKRYVRNAVMILMILTPLTLFITAVIGLIGYINLAWTMSRYQVQVLFIITSYIVVRGLMFDALELLSEWMISNSTNGWLWIEVILKPLDKILRVSLLILSLVIFCQLFGWLSDSAIVAKLQHIAEYPLVNISGIHITSVSIGEFLVVLAVFYWTAKWTREFCYRWLYRNTRDAGIRNSLSVFTQYAVILIGSIITLRVLGFDFSGMSMVIGGLAVGMGFGLRDFASNVVGGIMLLIERPVREGDLITLGNYEGRVSHIGIRSMRVSSWDNMEVLIPNAETFNKPFTNWTHQDSIIRTVVPIKVSRADDPSIIQQIILDVLAITPEIVSEPPAQVFLKKIDEALIEFEVRYFINVQTHTRFEVRSKVLFAIMEQFKLAGIKSPIPPISVELKEKEGREEKKYERALTKITPEQ